MSRRALLAAGWLLLAGPVLAYVLPAAGVLKRVSLKREELALGSLEVQGAVTFIGESATQAAEAGLPLVGGEASGPAFVTLKIPGRCRLEVALADAAPSERPAATVRAGKLGGRRGLERVPAAAALVQGLCALLGERPGGVEPERAWLRALEAFGVSGDEVTLGRQGGRVALVVGGKPLDEKPLAWIDKQTFQPLRLAATLAGLRQEVRLVDWGSAVAGDAFPRTVEVWAGGQLRLRFTAEQLVANPKVSDAIF